LHLRQANLNSFQKRPFYWGLKIFNNLPTEIIDLSGNPKKLKIALKR